MGPGGIAAIKVVGSLLGGLLGRNKQTVISAGDNFRSHMDGVMDSAAKYGFSPLTLAGVNAGQGTIIPGDNSSMGAGIADAAMFLGDALSKKTDAAKLQEVAAQRDRLQSQVETLTIRPKVPGIYGGASRAVAGSDMPLVRSAAGGSGGGRSLGGVFAADPRREVEFAKVMSDPGYVVVDNPALGGPFSVPSVNGEIPDIWQYPTIAAGWAATRATELGRSLRRTTDANGWTDPSRHYGKGDWRNGKKAPSLSWGTLFPTAPYYPKKFFTHPQTGFSAGLR